jgi:type VI secretion system protein ImpK
MGEVIDNELPSIKKQPLFHAGSVNNAPVSNKDMIKYEGVENIDFDVDLSFNLRGENFNPLIDAANPLISMVLSAKKVSSVDKVEGLYHRVRDETTAMFEEIKTLNESYDYSTQLSFRYCLCSFIDEMVMSTEWGKESIWVNQSMLAYFHNETWGGEKFFDILSRAILEPEKYQDLLEFLYLCLSLGFKGQYSVGNNGGERIQELLVRLNSILREQRGEAPESFLGKVNVNKVNYKLSRYFPLWGIWVLAVVVLTGAFLFYSISLDAYSDEILLNIDKILDNWSVN